VRCKRILRDCCEIWERGLIKMGEDPFQKGNQLTYAFWGVVSQRRLNKFIIIWNESWIFTSWYRALTWRFLSPSPLTQYLKSPLT